LCNTAQYYLFILDDHPIIIVELFLILLYQLFHQHNLHMLNFVVLSWVRSPAASTEPHNYLQMTNRIKEDGKNVHGMYNGIELGNIPV